MNWDLLPTKDVLTQYGGVDPKRFVPSGDYTAETDLRQSEKEANLPRRSRRGNQDSLGHGCA